MPVILWSDFIIYALVILLSLYAYFALKDSATRARWSLVYERPSRVVAVLVLSLFIFIGLLDSLHFIPKSSSHEHIMSVLDLWLKPISEQSEQSYSAPFANKLFVADMVKIDGEVKWVAKDLQHVSITPIWADVGRGFVNSVLILGALFVVFRLFYARTNKSHVWSTNVLTAWISLFVTLFITASCLHLIKHYHILGTDKIGTDVFYASIKSIRTGLIIGILTTMLTLPFAVIFGAMAGFYGGKIDDIIQYIYITLSSIPSVLLIAAAMLSLDTVIARHEDFFTMTAQRADAKLLLLCTILGITSWTTLCRILRGETLKLREQEFVLASKVMGATSMQIIIKHLVPNLTHIILIALILDFSGLVLAEAVLSYVGVGVDASMFSWGNMINGARMEMGRTPVIWWSLAGAFIMMFALVLAANIFADGVRDAFDTRAQ